MRADLTRNLESFRQVAPHVTIEWTGTGTEFLTKVTAAVAAGTPPDLGYLRPGHQGFFGKQKLLVDQGPLGKRDRNFRADLIEPRALEFYTYDGQVQGYPWLLTTGQVFFNRNLFRAAGQTTPDELLKQGRWTWQAMLEAAVALTRRAPDGTPQQVGIAQQAIWRLALQSNGTNLFDDFRRPKKSRLDEPAAVAALEYLQDLVHKHRAGWGDAESQTFGGNAIRNYDQTYDAGKDAMLVRHGVPAAYPQVEAATSAVPWPKGPEPKGAPAADLATEATCILRATKHLDAAWQYCAWYQKEWQRMTLQLSVGATQQDLKANARMASRSDLYDLSRASLPAPQDIWFDLVKLGVARPVFPDWPKAVPAQ